MGEADGVDVAAWNKRLAAIDWSKGDAIRGKEVFTRAIAVRAIRDAGPGAGPARAGRFREPICSRPSCSRARTYRRATARRWW